MAMQMVSRTQRRMEKKQALTLLSLILAVSLVSFTLGVMVGKGHRDGQVVQTPSVERMPVVAAAVPPSAPPASPAAENLTFYDSLPKGEQPPLGSGINLPQEAPRPEASASMPAKPRSEVKPAVDTSSSPPPAATAPAGTKVSWVIQAASFQAFEDARKLKERLEAKGFESFVKEADLGKKGKWYRVIIGPFPTDAAAQGMADRLKKEDKLTGLVRKNE